MPAKITKVDYAALRAGQRVSCLRDGFDTNILFLKTAEMLGIIKLISRNPDDAAALKGIRRLQATGFIRKWKSKDVGEQIVFMSKTLGRREREHLPGPSAPILSDELLQRIADQGAEAFPKAAAAGTDHSVDSHGQELANFLADFQALQERLEARRMGLHVPETLLESLLGKHWENQELKSERLAEMITRKLLVHRRFRHNDGCYIFGEDGRAYKRLGRGEQRLNSIQLDAMIDEMNGWPGEIADIPLPPPPPIKSSKPKASSLPQSLPQSPPPPDQPIPAAEQEPLAAQPMTRMPEAPTAPEIQSLNHPAIHRAMVSIAAQLHPEPMSATLRRRLAELKSA